MVIQTRASSWWVVAAIAVAGSVVLGISSASAQTTYTWANSNVTNTPTTLDWFTGGPNTQATWTGGTPVSSNLNTIQFFSAPPTAVPNTTTVTQGSNLNNGGTAFQLGTLTLSGQAPAPANQDLTMNVAGDALNFSATTGTINLNSVDQGGNGREIFWNVSNAIQLGTASSASTLTLTGSGASTFNFSGGFTELQVGGGSKLVKSGTSPTTLSGAVTVSGGLEVNTGTLRLINASNAITGGITLNGGTLGDNNGRITTQTLNNNLITVNGAANLGLEGGTTTNGGITLNSGANLTLATNASSATVNGAVTGVGSISIGQLGGGGHTQNLNSTANTFTGTISFTAASHAATLNVNSLADSASLGAGNIRFVGSAGSNAHTFALGSGAIAPVALDNRQIEIVSGSAAAYTIANNSSQAFAINTDLVVGATGARTLNLGGTGTGLSTFGGNIGNGSGTVSISKAGSGTWLFSGNNTYTGTTTVTAGTLSTTKAAALPGYDSAAKVVINGGTVGVQVGGSGWTTGQVDTLLTNATKTSGALGIDTTNGNLTQWAAFTTTNLGSALGLTKLGVNTLTLDQSNTFAGALTISQGTVSINTINNASSAGVLGNSANAVVLGSSGNTGTLLYTGATASSNKTFTAATSGTGAMNVQEAATNLTLSGAIGGSGNITKEGAGILTLGAANTYSGATTVNGGELRWGVVNAIAGGALDINDGGTVNMQTFSDTVGTITIAKGGSITGTTGSLTTGSFISNNGGTMTGATLVLSNNASVTYNSTGPGSTTFQIEKLSINDSGTNVFNIANGDAAVDFDITGFVNNGGNNVGRTITKTGAGAMQFSGSTMGAAGQNSISLNINEGTILMNRAANTAFVPGGDGLITVGDGVGSAGSAILRFADTGGNEQLGNRSITINSDGLFDLNGKSETTSGTVTVNSGSVTTGAGNLTLSGGTVTILTLRGNASINGTTTFSGAAGAGITATGTTSIAGTLAFGSNSRTIAVNTGSDTLTITASITGGGALTKNGAGTLQIGDGTTAGAMSSASGLTMGGGTLAVRGPASGGSSQTVASLATSAATGSIIRLTPGDSGDTTLTITSNTPSTGAGSSVNFDYTAGTTVGGAVGNNYVVWNPSLTGGIIGGAYTVTDSGGTGFATTSSGTVVRRADPGSAGLPVSAGSSTGSYFVASGYSTDSTTTPGSLVVALSGAVAASNVSVDTTGLAAGANLTLGTNLLTLGAGMVFDGPNPYEITGSGAGGLRAAASGGTINLYNANTGTVTISAPIIDNSASRLTVDGPGTTILSGVNTYTGATVVNGGTVRFSGTMAASGITINNNAVAQLGTSTGLSSSNSITFGAGATGSLQLLGSNVTVGALNSNTTTLGTPVITNSNAANATLTIDSGSGSTFGGVIQDGAGGGTLALVKSGAGTLALSGTNTYSGGTTINAGTVSATSDAFLGNASGGITFNGGRLFSNGGNLNMARNITVTGTGSSMVVNKNNNFSTSGALTGSGSLAFPNAGGSGTTSIYSFTSTGNTFSGSMSLDLADVRVSSLGDAAGNNIVFTNTGTFSLNSSDVTTGLTFNSRAIELSNTSATVSNNNATHAITIGGNLVATGAAAKTLTLSAVAGPTNVFSGSITNGTGGGTVGLTKSGAGTWVIGSGVNTYTGVTTIGGILIIDTLSNYSAPSSLGAPTSGDIIFDKNQTSTLIYVGDGNSTNRTIRHEADVSNRNNNSGIYNNGTGAVVFNGSTFNTPFVASGNGGRTTVFNLGGVFADSANQIAGVIADNDATSLIAITKNADPSSWQLSGSNTYSGGSTISGGTVRGTQTSGTPFGTGAVTINAGVLSLAPTGSGSAVSVTGGTRTSGTLFTYNAGAAVSLARGNQTSFTYTFGGTGATTARGTNGTLILSTSDIANFGAAGTNLERFIMNGTAPTQVNTLVSGVVIQDRNTSNAGDFATYDATNGFTKASYTLTNTFTGSTNVSRVEITSATSTGSIASYAIKANATVTNSGTITLGSSGNPAGLILNGGSIIGGILAAASGNPEFLIYTSGTSSISSAITSTNTGMSIFGAGSLALSSSNSFTGGLRVNNSTLIVTNDNQLGGANNALTLRGGTLQTSGDSLAIGAGARAITLAAGQDQTGGTFSVTSGTTTFQNNSSSSRIISGSGSLTKTGSGILELAGNTNNTYSGTTNVNAGTLAISGAASINSTSAINVAAGARFANNSSVALALAPTLGGNGTGSRAVYGGTGTLNAALTLDNVGDVLSPGNSPGIMSFGVNQSWGSYSYDWELNDWAAKVAGTNIDQINITGSLTLAGATPGSYILNVLSLTGGDVSGAVPNFSDVNNSWTILTTTGGISGFSADFWTINDDGFSSSPTATGSWSVAQSGNNLVLNYVAVPEPATIVLVASGAAILGSLLARRRRGS